MGRNGSGKSSLLWALQGSGRAAARRVDGTDPASSASDARRLVGLVPQTPADLLYLDTVAAECAQADARRGRTGRHMPGAARPPRRRRRRPTPIRAICPKGSGSRSCSRCSSRPRPRCCCSTSRPAASTPTAKARFAHDRHRARRSRARRSSSRRTTSSSSPTCADRVVVLADGEIVADGPTADVVCRVAGVRAPGREDPAPAPWLTVAEVADGARATATQRCDVQRRDGRAASAPAPRLRSLLVSIAGLVIVRLAAARRRPERRSRTGSDAPFIFAALLRCCSRSCSPRCTGGRLDTKAIAHARRALRARRRAAPARRGHRRHRDGLLPARARRAGLRARLRVRARFARRCSRRRCSPAASGRGCRSRCSPRHGSGSAPGCCPPARGRAEIVLLAAYGAVSAFVYGLLLNLWFWPFTIGADTQLSFVAGAPVVENLHRFLLFTLATSPGAGTPAARSPTPSRSWSSVRPCSSC